MEGDKNKQKKGKGSIIIWTLVFSSVFLIILGGLFNYFVFQISQNRKTVASSYAFDIAESGINYARWHLAHFPNDFSFSGTYDFKNPSGSVEGKYTLEITPPSACSSAVGIKSTGWQNGFSSEKRSIGVKYAKPSLAKYAFLTNLSAWFGEEEELKGPFHSNGGIRMDGKQNSISSSAKETYICGAEHGCSKSNCNTPCSWTSKGCQCPGIWGEGDGGKNGLWDFPESNIDFNKVTRDLSLIKSEAQSDGVYLGDSGRYGYHIKFRSDGTFDVYKVSRLEPAVWGYDGNRWVIESNSIRREVFYRNYEMPVNCAPVFVEDNLWVDGEVNGRITVVSAKLPDTPGTNTKIIIGGNIKYVSANSVLGLIAQKDILIPLYSPDDLEVDAAMIAQKGHIFRYYYPYWWFEPYRTYALRHKITTYGSIITNTIWTFSWVNSSNKVISGYQQTELNYDTKLKYDPPPYFPVTGDYDVVDWEEVAN